MGDCYVFPEGIQVGPFTPDQVRKMLDAGKISPETPVRYSDGTGAKHYMKAGEFVASAASSGEPAEPPTAELLSVEPDALRVACPVCGQHYRVEDDRSGVKCCKCLECERDFLLPPRPGAGLPDGGEEAEVPDGDLLCPHCWKSFDPDYVLYISVHPDLFGDPVLGKYAPKRFVPTVFNQSGQPLDEKGLPATEMACPRCHLRIPAGLLDTPALYFSIAGAISSGKSHLLTCMTHQLRRTLPEYFGAAFFDADPRLNETLSSYERELFMSLSPEKVTSLPATQISGDGISNRVRLNDTEIELPQPFVFEFRSRDGVDDLNMVFYDNSGEMFVPGRDEWGNQATFHLSHSDGIIFLFDPTSDAVMRGSICDRRDPQISCSPHVVDQTLLFNEMIDRIRRHANMLSSDTCKIPLVVAVVKYDTWRDGFDRTPAELPLAKPDSVSSGESWALDRDRVLDVSFALRELLLKYVPGLVNAAESFFESVTFVPVSNFGTLAERNDEGVIGIVPEKLKPIWVEVPFLTLLAQNNGLIRSKTGSAGAPLGTWINGQLGFAHPVTGRPVRLPGNYAGAGLEIGGTLYRLPAKDDGGEHREN